jgi:hypothetical protein
VFANGACASCGVSGSQLCRHVPLLMEPLEPRMWRGSTKVQRDPCKVEDVRKRARHTTEYSVQKVLSYLGMKKHSAMGQNNIEEYQQ